MEGEVDAQIVTPTFFHHQQALPGPFHQAPLLSKKRDFRWKNPSFHRNQQLQSQQRLMGASLPNTRDNWKSKMWDWDSVKLMAKPSSDTSEVLFLGFQPYSATTPMVDQMKKGDEGTKGSVLRRNMKVDNENHALKLGGGAYSVVEEPTARPYKRVSAKDYHRRHKVCEVHSNTSKALVGKRMEKSCQQCSSTATAGGTKDKQTSIPPLTDRDHLVQFISNLSASTEVHLNSNKGNWKRKCNIRHNKPADSSLGNVPQQTVQQVCPSLPLQFFGPAGDVSPPELGSAIKYLSSEISNHVEERGENATVELSTSHGGSALIELFEVSETQAESRVVQSLPYQAGYKSSASDHSTLSWSSDAQILNWLSNSPSEMESYLRPGCVILSIYLRMQSIAWEALENDLQHATSLVQSSEAEFWRNGRFLVRTNRQLKTSLVLKGCNLIVPGTNPSWVTPLHLEASMQDSEDIVDALTNDPQEIGLKCWNSLMDENDQSP
ncbi:Squamosa promoter-binding-like protein [Musa troglodytarum]|uniref:Squamosa promoter-binding-like protein n=1 Tax=Musa troglodytarum TaxID=320322 RepID=A0A9E7L8T0_9LILI|nr:Squamosa promoter-binding-like protein [Musa troglodytarum]